jgi:hypothetical protein
VYAETAASSDQVGACVDSEASAFATPALFSQKSDDPATAWLLRRHLNCKSRKSIY